MGDDDRSLLVDEFDGEDYELRLVVDAAQTPPFLTDRRIVVARDIGRFTAEELGRCSGTSPIRSTRPNSCSSPAVGVCRRSCSTP